MRFKLLLLLIVVALAAYANTLRNGYAIDDVIMIQNNRIVAKGFIGIPELFRTSYFAGSQRTTFDYYRPFPLAVFASERALFGDSPFAGHLVNILLFAACVAVLFLFFDDLFERQRTVVAFIAALLFALHPVNTEVVANIKSCDLLLCFFFSFLSLRLFNAYRQKAHLSWLIGGFACYFLALLCKENALTFLFFIPFVFFCYLRSDGKKAGIIIAGACAVAGLYLALRFAVLGSFNGGANARPAFIDNMLPYAPNFASRLATELLVLGNYLRLLLMPSPLISDYSYKSIDFTGFGNVWVWVSALAYVGMSVIAGYRLFRRARDPYAFALLFYLVSISIVSNIFYTIPGVMAERFLFFGGVGFCLAAALLIGQFIAGAARLANWRKLAFILVPVSLIYLLLTVSRNAQWYSNTTLLQADLRHAPANCHLLYSYGTDLLIRAAETPAGDAAKERNTEEGLRYLKKAAAVFPGFNTAYSEIGNTYLQLQNFDSAELYCRRAIAGDPHDMVAGENLAAIYFKTGKYRDALQICGRMVVMDTAYARGYRNIGNCYMKLGKYDSAIDAYKASIAIEPSVNLPYERIAIAYKLVGNSDSAGYYLKIARFNNPEFSY